jgi:hypothetical protein
MIGVGALAALWSSTLQAQVTPDLEQKIDTMVRLCVAGGQQFTVTGGGSGGAEISLRAFDVKGNLKGDIHVDKSQAEGLVNGIDNAISQTAANEVDKVRDCLKPVRDRVLDILFPPQATPQAPAPPQGAKSATSLPQQAQQPAAVSNQGPVDWNLDSQFLLLTGGGPDATINSVLLQGTSTVSVGMKEAYAVSGLTGHRQELMANVQYKGYYPVDKVDIPPGAPVWVELIFKPPLSIRDFLSQWGQFRVTIVYNDGTNYVHDFNDDYTRRKIQQMDPFAFGPHVTPRSD